MQNPRKWKINISLIGDFVETLPFETKEGHYAGALVHYKGQPTAVGGMNFPYTNYGYTETLTQNGWEELVPHPR